jgi:amino acid adenylation domain-containing protein
MLQDAGVRVVITDATSRERLPHGDGPTYVDVNNPAVEKAEPTLPNGEPSPSDLAYIIYTSGSTGQPKGVQITHRALKNLVSWHQRAFAITAEDRASQVASIGFDAAVWEIWPYLTAGATLFFMEDQRRSDPVAFRDWLLTNRISIAFAPTAVAEQMIGLSWPPAADLRILLTGGDKLRRYPPSGLPFTLVNNYGPTEAAVVATSGEVPPEETDSEPSIGYPIDNTKIYVLDEHLQPVPQGVTGEIYIGGAGLARGYVNRPDLTAARFVVNPFSGERAERLYRTGDLGFYRPDGQIAFRGRNDDQISIRGYRIEPNEIVAALNRQPAVRASAVKAVENGRRGEKQLTAYVVTEGSGSVTATELREFLRHHLPEYMVPSVFVGIPALPITANGKVDREALPAPNAGNLLQITDSISPSTAVQQQLLSILRKLLKVENISLSDNFFLLGGHSLLGAQLIAKVKENFGVKLTLIDLFDKGTIAAMAEQIERIAQQRAA